MKKYLAVAKIFFKVQIIYRFDVALTAAAGLGRVLAAWVLWGVVFAGRERVGGFTFQGMLSYYVVCSFLASIEVSAGVCGEVSQRIRGGTFSKYMVIPAKPLLYFVFQGLGASGYYALFSILAAGFCTLVFRVGLTLAADPPALLAAVLMILLGLLFMNVYQFLIGILTFKFQDMGFFTHVQGPLLSFFTGTLVPLALLPEAALKVLRFLPFTYVTYTPAMLLTGQATAGEGCLGLAVLSVWTAALYVVGQWAYHRLRIKFDGVGI
jgi:ABC-2 type transport system permease protein